MGEMSVARIIGVVLIVAGALGLVYGSFSFTRETHEAQVGPITLTVKDKETVNIPVRAGVAGIVIGKAFLLLGAKRS